MEVLDWLIENRETLLVGAGLVLGGLAILAKLTPTPKDDHIIGKLIKFLKLAPTTEKKDSK